ncbi:MAG: phenylalanine--tRNA ligase subunit alpha [Planctomycetota bacterium]
MNPLDSAKKLFEGALAKLQAVKTPEELESWRLEFLSRSGEVSRAMDLIKSLPNELKKDYGRVMNIGRSELEKAFADFKDRLGKPLAVKEIFDATLPGTPVRVGHQHPLTSTLDEIFDIFSRMGFGLVESQEIETEFFNFDALNIPSDHPSHDSFDTFYIREDTLLRSHTSPGQARTMLSRKPPIRVLIPGRCYRPDAVDATHHYAFHQCEGLLVEERVTFADMKGMLAIFAREMFGTETKTRFRPSFFPFTEPSAEMDVTCPFCSGKGCGVCKHTTWIEILGCGMVNPAVFEKVNYDTERYTGFAFGIGLERVAMLKHGIPDIRYFQENNLRFLEQF